MGIGRVFAGCRLSSAGRIVRAASREASNLVGALRPLATICANQGIRLLVNGGPAFRISAATLVATTVTMCSYWAQSSVGPAAAPVRAADVDPRRSTEKSDRLDAYVREERAAGVLADAPSRRESPASLPWPLSDRISTGVHVGPHGERAYGIRIAVPVGTPVRAAAAGIVQFAGKALDGYGNKIVLRHGKIRTVYGHLSAILVAAKTKVRKGQVIARSGQSGFATSPQLYLGLLGADASVDPIAFFAKAGTLARCTGDTAACAERARKTAASAPPRERRPVPPASIPLAGSQRAARL